MWRWLRQPKEELRKTMMRRHLHEVCSNKTWGYKNDIHPVFGLHVIKDFEEVNGVKFDVFNPRHREVTRHCRVFISIIHQRLKLERWNKKR